MTIQEFLEKLKPNVSEITYLSIQRILLKLYKEDDLAQDIESLLSNYPLYLRYLNDFAGTIYKQYFSSIDDIYNETCAYLNIESDNEFLFTYRLNRLLLNDISRIMGIQNEEIKEQTIEKQYVEFEKLKNSKYYNLNQTKYKDTINKLSKNFDLLRSIVGNTSEN